MATYGGFSALFMKLMYPKKEFVLTLQEGDPIEYIMGRLGIFKPLYRAIFSHADKVQVISNYLAQFARGMGFRGEPIVIPNGVDIAHFSKIVNEKVIEKKEGDIILINSLHRVSSPKMPLGMLFQHSHCSQKITNSSSLAPGNLNLPIS
jgi:hypothetical protein